MGLAITHLGSGSKGNAALVSSGDLHVLVDQGLSLRQIEKRMLSVGVDPAHVSAVLITHEHGDHAGHVERFHKRWGADIHASTIVSKALELPKETHEFELLERIDIGSEISALPRPVPHDSKQNVAFLFSNCDGNRAAIATDLGHATDELIKHLRSCQHISIEANYEDRLLDKGPYPVHLKERIRGRLGHLSNDQTARLLSEAITPQTTSIALLHLSEKNNRPHSAETAVLCEVEESFSGVLGVCSQTGPDFTIHVGEAALHRPGSGLVS